MYWPAYPARIPSIALADIFDCAKATAVSPYYWGLGSSAWAEQTKGVRFTGVDPNLTRG